MILYYIREKGTTQVRVSEIKFPRYGENARVAAGKSVQYITLAVFCSERMVIFFISF